MCSPAAAQIVEDVVTEFMAGHPQFTAKDITDEVKGRMQQAGLPFERHNDLKGTVHSVCDAKMDANWEQTAVRLPGIPVAPFLYHRVGTDPQDYVKAYSARGSLPAAQFASPAALVAIPNTPAAINGAFGPSGNPVPRFVATPAPAVGRFTKPVGTTAAKRTVPDPGNRPVVKGGRLIVARKFLEAVGYSAGDLAKVYAANNALTIPAKGAAFAGSNPFISIHVDAQGRIRLNKKSRESLGVVGTQFKIAQAGQTVQVQPA